jgi:tetratricopeptide (TPR) repeat protein
MGRWRNAAFLIAFATMGGCARCGSGERSDAAPVAATAVTSLTVEHSGCGAIVRDEKGSPVCELEGHKLRIWVPVDKPETTHFFVDDATNDTAVHNVSPPEKIGEGVLYVVELPAGARKLTVEATTAEGKRSKSLTLAAASPIPWFDEAKALKEKGEHAETLTRLEPWLGSKSAKDRALSRGLAARAELARGNVDAALGHFREAIAADRVAGRISAAADDAFALVFALNQRGRGYAEARTVLEGLDDLLRDYPDGRAREPYYRGVLDGETGDPRSWLHNVREAETRARRLGLGRLARTSAMSAALALQRMGRIDESLAGLRAVAKQLEGADDVAPCERVEAAINLGFGAILANEEADAHGTPRSEDAIAPLERAIALRDQGCPDPYLQSFALGNLALAALNDHRIDVGRARLAEAKKGVAKPRIVEILFWHDLDGLLSLEAGDAKRALGVFDEERKLAAASLQRESEWNALIGRGRALEALHRIDDAIATYREAEALLDDGSLDIPLGEGRSRFLGGRDRGARSAIELLVLRGKNAEAMAIARTSRARVLAGVERGLRLADLAKEERARWDEAVGAYRQARAELDQEASSDWKLAEDALARVMATRRAKEAKLRATLEHAMATFARKKTPRDAGALAAAPKGTLTLAFHPERRGFVGFAADDSGVMAARVGVITPEMVKDRAALAERVLSPFRERIHKAERLRILSYGVLRDVDFHALSFEGAPLVRLLPVEYPLDTGDREPAEAPPAGSTPMALVVADPNGDLPSARQEARRVADALTKRGVWKVQLLEGEKATSLAVSRDLQQARLLHYAGHGVYAGREGWESVLPLAAGSRLLLGDILAMNHAPTRVVLSSCETARTALDAPAEGLGVAQAFVTAGSEAVIAPVRPVKDVLGAKLSDLLYGKLVDPGPVDAAAMLREAQLAIQNEDPMSDWAAFRVLLP